MVVASRRMQSGEGNLGDGNTDRNSHFVAFLGKNDSAAHIR
jgi:hypothetical protein